MFCFIWPNFLSMGICWYLIPKHWNWQICHTHWAFKFHFTPLAESYKLFPQWKDDWIYSQSNPTIYSSSLQKSAYDILPEKELLSAACFEVAGLCYTTLCTWLHYECLKIAGIAWQNNNFLVLQTCISHHNIVKRGKDKLSIVVRTSTALAGPLVLW